MKNTLTLIFALILLVSCGSRKRTTSRKSQNSENKTTEVKKTDNTAKVPVKGVKPVYINNTNDYINAFKTVAIEEMKTYKIPASITLAQGILESGSGKGRLAREANNHFGIKCHNWTGAKIYHDDDKRQECFRKYSDVKYSFRDHSEFLAKRKRYAKLFQLDIDDYKGWARELRKAGYATDKKYPEKLITLIERYNLTQYDEKPVGIHKRKKSEVLEVVKYTVKKGDTLYSISKRYNITIKELQKLNSLSGTEINIGQVLKIESED